MKFSYTNKGKNGIKDDKLLAISSNSTWNSVWKIAYKLVVKKYYQTELFWSDKHISYPL